MAVKQNVREVERWGLFELTLDGPSEGNPFQEVQLSARFQYRNRVVQPDGFYDGNGTYRIRFMPDQVGTWRFTTISNSSELDGITGEFVCTQPSLGNHGPVSVKDSYTFEYADGTRYMPFGTTCYHWTHYSNEVEEMTLETLKETPYNKVRMIVLPTKDMKPEQLGFGLAFEGDTPENLDKTRFNTSFFAHFEKRVQDLMDLGIEADIILFHPYDKGFWGVDNMDLDTDCYYLRYVIARLGAFRNVWWSLSNEYDFNKFKTVSDWDHLIQFVQQHDPYQRLRSIHNGTKMYKISTFYDYSKNWITHQSVQHWDMEQASDWRAQYAKPVVIDELCYEGNSSRRWGNISGQEMTHRFWEGMSRGAYLTHGESFIDKETRAWISCGGKIYGTSTPRIAFLRSIMEAGPADWMKAKEQGTYVLEYLGNHQYAYKYLNLPETGSYRIELIDTWNMTITELKGTYSGECKVELPSKPYMALRITKIEE